MASQVVECTKPTQCVVPTGKQYPTNTKTHEEIPIHGPEDIQQANAMPNGTRTHRRILQALCPDRTHRMPLRGHTPDPPAYHPGVQNPPTTLSHPRTR